MNTTTGRKLTHVRSAGDPSAVLDPPVRSDVSGLPDPPGSTACRFTWGRSPQPSEGQQGLRLKIHNRLGLLGLPLCEQINSFGEGCAYEEAGEPDQPPAPALHTEPDQQAIAVVGELEATGGLGVSWRPWWARRRTSPPSGAGSRTRDCPASTPLADSP